MIFKRKYILAAYFLLFFYVPGFCQSTFVRVYNSIADSSYYMLENVDTTDDGGFIITGNLSDSLVYGNAFLLKLDSQGLPQWSKGYSASWSMGYDVLQTSDRGYLLAATGWSQAGSEDIFLVRSDSIGDTLWTKLIGGMEDEKPRAIFQTADFGFVIAGTTESFGSGVSEMMLLKIDSLGNPLWARYFGTYDSLWHANTEEVMDAIQTPTGGYVLAGWVYYEDKALLIETDSLGNILWSKSFETMFELQSIKPTSDGYLLTSGSFLIKTDLTGNILWNTSFYNWPIQAYELQDSNLCWVNGNGLVKCDTLGNIQWTRKFTTPAGTFSDLKILIPLSSGEFFLAGELGQTTYSSMTFIKTDLAGNSICFENDSTYVYPVSSLPETIPTILLDSTLPSVNYFPVTVNDILFQVTDCTWENVTNEKTEIEFQVYPNPATSKFAVHSSQHALLTRGAAGLVSGQLEIFNSLGEKINSAPFSELSTVDCNSFPKGIYFVRLCSDNQNAVQKLVVE